MPPVLRLYFRSVATLDPSCYFPARSINMDTRQGSQSTASRAREIKAADGRDIGAGKRSATIRARRESEEQIPRQPEARSCRGDGQEEPPHAVAAIQNYSTQVSSKFRRNSLKTKKRCTRQVTHISRVSKWALATNHSFLVDTLAIRDALKSNEPNATITSDRHRLGAPLTVEFPPSAQIYPQLAFAVPALSAMMGRTK